MAETTSTTMDGKEKGSRAGYVAAWLGWAFDGLDSYLYTLVAIPLVASLLGAGASKADVAAKAGLIQGIFLFGWALGGIVFGRVGDMLGRSRTLTLTIVTYAVFTSLTFFAQTWEQLALLRFIAALGIGGEWAAGSALVSETLKSKYRPYASALLQSGYMVGMILAAVTVGALGSLPPKWVFLVGVLPAFVTIWIRKAVPEPHEWSGEREAKKVPPLSALFQGKVAKTTWLTIGLSIIALTTVWAVLYFSIQIVRSLPELASLKPAEMSNVIRNFTIEYAAWNIVGNFVTGFWASRFGYRKTIFALFLASLFLLMYGFQPGRSLNEIRFAMDLVGFSALGIFAIFPLYIPPLFPTLLRTTGAGMTYNIGRVAAGLGTFWLGSQTAAVSPNLAISSVAILYIPGLIIAAFMPELNEKGEVAG